MALVDKISKDDFVYEVVEVYKIYGIQSRLFTASLPDEAVRVFHSGKLVSTIVGHNCNDGMIGMEVFLSEEEFKKKYSLAQFSSGSQNIYYPNDI